jgi:exonuclease SbcC
MKLFTPFRSPAWEQRDPAKRAAAVREEQVPELLARLPQIATEDEDAGVRRAALGRLQDPALLLERQRADADPATRAAAAARLSRLLLDPAAGLSLETRRKALELALPAELMEHVAEAAPEVELRGAALQRVSRAGFLQKRVVEETDAALRETALARIEGEEVLERLAEALRKRDKVLARRARDRVLALRLARGDRATLDQYALDLCEALSQWAQQLPSDLEARLEEARAVFEARRAQLDETMQRRVEAYFERVHAALARRETRAAEVVAVAATSPARGGNAIEVQPPAAEALPAAAPTASDVQAAAHSPPTGQAAPPRPAPDLSEFDAALKRTEHALREQKLGEARPAFERMRELFAGVPRGDRARRERFAQAEEKLGELEQWQRWSGNRVRARLCDDLEALIAAGHHPDAVAHRVRELQAEWAKVEAAEPGDADRSSGLARRFRALCGKAMAPTKAYFDQRHALREQKREGYGALLAEAAEDKLAALAPPALVGLRRKLTEGLRGLDELEPKVRSALARRLRDALARIDAALDAQREDAALTRRKLIAKLRRELTHADPGTALALAREAQLEWKTLPRAGREAEAELEQELRALIDPLFAAEREARQRGNAEQARVEAESRRLLAEIEALSQGDAETLAHAEGRIAALQAQWRELHANAGAHPGLARERSSGLGRDARGARRADAAGARSDGAHGSGDRGPRRDDARGPGERGLRNDVARGSGDRGPRRDDPRGAGDRGPRRDDRGGERRARFEDPDRPFDQAVAKVRQAQAVLENSRRGARLLAIAEAFVLFARMAEDDAGKSEAAWQALALDEADRKRLAARWQQAVREPEAVLATHDEALDSWLVEAELDAGLESPPQSQALRRQRQMQRLATRLQGAALAAADPRERLLQFATLSSPSAARRGEFERRLQAVLAAWSR